MELNASTNAARLAELIRRAASSTASGRVVVLIDEYDKPVVDHLDDMAVAQRNIALLRDIYSVLKDHDRLIDYFLLTRIRPCRRCPSPPGSTTCRT